MGSKEELIEALNNRRLIYWFFSRICEKEIKDDFLKQLISIDNPLLKITLPMEIDDEDIKEGLKMMKNYIEDAIKRDLKEVELELAVDYANIFLGVKHAKEKKGPTHPSESVYKTGLLMQEPVDEVLQAYWSAGVDVVKEFKEPADHAAIELQFISYLCRKTSEALQKTDKENVLKYLKAQKDFLEKHILQWIPKLAIDIQEAADTDFYRGFGKILGKYVQYDKEIIDVLLEDVNAL
ncbi:MAG: molecular chaperone TorD family protein [Nitrososphaeria archaeon]|nr:molecular chaperone TorD family protein [Nitrososphaeria archaeon]MDW7986569.1 molecular chaperone TorD family protein [Nitrososphaerota archaeon]